MSTEKVHFQMEMFGIADRSVNGRIEGQKVQNSSLAGCGKSRSRGSVGFPEIVFLESCRGRNKPHVLVGVCLRGFFEAYSGVLLPLSASLGAFGHTTPH